MSAGPRVAVDVTPLLTLQTGIGRSVAETVAALGRLEAGPELVPYAFAARAAERAAAPAGTRVVPLPTRLVLQAWSRAEHPRIERWTGPADVRHATNFVVPPGRTPTLVTVHDCSFALFPETVTGVVSTFPAVRGLARRRAVAHVTTEQGAREVEEVFGPGLRAAGQVVVVPFGVPSLSTGDPPSPRARAVVTGDPYVLAIGRTEPRKNLVALVRAFGLSFDRLGDRPVRLVLAGPPGHDHARLLAAVEALPGPARERVDLLGPVDEGSRVALLRGAALLAYPSVYEGFGFPVLEAMSLGVPVLAGDVPALAEVAGGAARLADPHDDAALAAALAGLLGDRDALARLAAGGPGRAAAFTWQRTAAGLDRAYRELSSSS